MTFATITKLVCILVLALVAAAPADATIVWSSEPAFAPDGSPIRFATNSRGELALANGDNSSGHHELIVKRARALAIDPSTGRVAARYVTTKMTLLSDNRFIATLSVSLALNGSLFVKLVDDRRERSIEINFGKFDKTSRLTVARTEIADRHVDFEQMQWNPQTAIDARYALSPSEAMKAELSYFAPLLMHQRVLLAARGEQALEAAGENLHDLQLLEIYTKAVRAVGLLPHDAGGPIAVADQRGVASVLKGLNWGSAVFFGGAVIPGVGEVELAIAVVAAIDASLVGDLLDRWAAVEPVATPNPAPSATPSPNDLGTDLDAGSSDSPDAGVETPPNETAANPQPDGGQCAPASMTENICEGDVSEASSSSDDQMSMPEPSAGNEEGDIGGGGFNTDPTCSMPHDQAPPSPHAHPVAMMMCD